MSAEAESKEVRISTVPDPRASTDEKPVSGLSEGGECVPGWLGDFYDLSEETCG
ncbi:hypothetical protein [Curtobacterium sp. 24E2]|nr:hypothetical protein JN350_10795 [Curtobacterium sp. 24E2]